MGIASQRLVAIAERYGVLVQRLSTAILVSTALGVITVSLAVMAAQG